VFLYEVFVSVVRVPCSSLSVVTERSTFNSIPFCCSRDLIRYSSGRIEREREKVRKKRKSKNKTREQT
jgi:hypothetical protein